MTLPRMSAKKRQPRKRIKQISDKRLAEMGGKVPFSSIARPTVRPPFKLRKPIRAVNPEAEAKRKSRRKKNHAEYRKSETFKLVKARAAGQCEGSLQWERVEGGGMAVVLIRDDLRWMAFAQYVRCGNTGGLQHHHRRYPSTAGGEQPDDMTVLCKRCHEWIERFEHSTRRNGR